VLLFSGDLGHYGGHADLELLDKVARIKEINPKAEIGWDGGANESNVKQLADGGVDTITVGGAIQNSENPENTYATLVEKSQN
jgi:ribulose-phosphate 3-epimerase